MPDGLLRVLIEDDSSVSGWTLLHLSGDAVLVSHRTYPTTDGGVPLQPTAELVAAHFWSLPPTAKRSALGWLLSTDPDAGVSLLIEQPFDHLALQEHLAQVSDEQRAAILQAQVDLIELPDLDEGGHWDVYGADTLLVIYGDVPGFLEKAEARAVVDRRWRAKLDVFLALRGHAPASERLCEGLFSATRDGDLNASGLDALVVRRTSCEWVPEVARRDLLSDAWWCGQPPTLCPVEASTRAAIARVAHLLPVLPPEDGGPPEDEALEGMEEEAEQAHSPFGFERPTPLRAALAAMKRLPPDLALRLQRATYRRLESPRECGRYWQAVLALPAEVRSRVVEVDSTEGLGQQATCRVTVDDARRTMQAVALE